MLNVVPREITSQEAAQLVSNMLDRLREAKAKAAADTETPDDHEAIVNRFKKIEGDLEKLNNSDLLPRIKQWEETLLHNLSEISGGINLILESATVGTEAIVQSLDRMAADMERIKRSIPPPVRQLMPSRNRMITRVPKLPRQEQKISLIDLKDCIYESPAVLEIWKSYEQLESIELKMCCLSFSIFSEHSVIKKRPLIYWWIGEGFVVSTQEKTAEEVGEEIFKKLLTLGFIQPHLHDGNDIPNFLFLDYLRIGGKRKCDSIHYYPVVVNRCTLHRWIRHLFIFLAEEAQLFDFDPGWPRMPSVHCNNYSRRACLVVAGEHPNLSHGITKADRHNAPEEMKNQIKEDALLTVFNVNARYLSLEREWLNKLKKVVVLQLGRWQSSPRHHIEVLKDKRFLKGLGAQQSLKYLSLRGISGITQLPSCIFKIISLEILDLRACHDLQTLPSDISSLRKLTHFDISECYFLECLPRGLDKLSCLQVLKGFVIATLEKTPCRLGDFAKLKKLRRLSIHIGTEAVIQQGEFNDLKEILTLRHLKISWGVVSPVLKAKIAFQSLQFSFPPDLEKFDLQGIPVASVPEWLNPCQLKNLKKLYIRGGKLGSLDHGETEYRWKVEILRLKYLDSFYTDAKDLDEEFPHLRYLKKIGCRGTYFINGDILLGKAGGCRGTYFIGDILLGKAGGYI